MLTNKKPIDEIYNTLREEFSFVSLPSDYYYELFDELHQELYQQFGGKINLNINDNRHKTLSKIRY